jgi:hypothetical protein
MKASCDPDHFVARDLTHGITAWLFWYLPIAAIIAGGIGSFGGAWLLAAALAVMGTGCLMNLVRCGRIHCYVTAPLLLLAAFWALLAALGIVSLHSNVLSLAVIGISLLACAAEVPLGRYRRQQH